MNRLFPLRIVAMTAVLLSAACGSDDEDAGGLLGGGAADTSKPVLRLAGPERVAPAMATSGFTATLARTSGQAIEEVFVALVASAGGIDAPPLATNSGGANTDELGRVAFAFRSPDDITEPVTVTIEGQATVGGITVEDSLMVTVQPDIFQFRSPVAGSPITVGSQNAQPVQFQWTRPQGNGTQGVAGSLRLSVNNGARLVINDDPLSAAEQAQVNTTASSGGDFAVPVAVYSNSSGFVTLTATDAAQSRRSVALSLQFTDSPSEINLSASPLAVTVSPSDARFSSLEITVLNQASQPITGVDVDFQLVQSASGSVNERVFPGGGTTNASGKASSRYEAGPTPGTATVRACVRVTGECDERAIAIRAAAP